MTVAEAPKGVTAGRHEIETVLRLKSSESMGTAVQPAIDALRIGRVVTLVRLFEIDLAELARVPGAETDLRQQHSD